MAKEYCANCGELITDGGIFGAPNWRLRDSAVSLVNFYHNAQHDDLCSKCGDGMHTEAAKALSEEYDRVSDRLKAIFLSFPMMTIGSLPQNVNFKVIGLVTANITAGTGIFNELSQGMSDLFGAVNSQTGMAHKVNQGEAEARRILTNKAIGMGANCIIGVDVDYGVTGNNSATVNMQGTAVHVSDLSSILSPKSCQVASEIEVTMRRAANLNRWLLSEFEDGEVYSAA